MSQKIRQEQILEILKKQGYVTVRYLSDALQYSTATINRDLNSMQRSGLVKRSYGGVEIAKKKKIAPLTQRQFYRKKEKRRIAEEAVKLIKSGDTVFLDGSTTVQYMIPFLSQRKDIRIITNSLRLAIELGDSNMEIICLGGRITERPYVLYSDQTLENVMRYHPDKMFFSVDRITESGDVHSYYYLFHKVLLKNSAQSWLLTDKTKVVDQLEETLCDFSRLTGIISDFDFPEETKNQYPDVMFISAT